MTRIVALAMLGALAIGPEFALQAQGGKTFKAKLLLMPLKLEQAATLSGSGQVTAVLTGTKLSITGTYEGLKSPATGARLHRSPKGIRGPAVFDLTVSGGTSGTISGDLTLTQAQVGDLGLERFSVQLRSETAPEGLLWGWLQPQESAR